MVVAVMYSFLSIPDVISEDLSFGGSRYEPGFKG